MNQFFLLCWTVCLAVATLSLIAGTLLTQLAWTALCRARVYAWGLRHPSFLFVVRTLPLSIPFVVVCCAVLPSFLIFEPRQTIESAEWWLVALAIVPFFVVGCIATRLATLLVATSQAKRRWLRSSRKVDVPSPIPVYELDDPDCVFAVVGIFSPLMFIGKRILVSLTRQELHAAVAHELAHFYSLDNCKQALLTATGFPSLFLPIDRMLRTAMEVRADGRAVRCRISPLELGGAIIKVARLKTTLVPSIAASHLVPDFESSTLRFRIEHLHALLEERRVESSGGKCGWLVAVTLLILYLGALPLFLQLAHRLTELLVR